MFFVFLLKQKGKILPIGFEALRVRGDASSTNLLNYFSYD